MDGSKIETGAPSLVQGLSSQPAIGSHNAPVSVGPHLTRTSLCPYTLPAASLRLSVPAST